MVDETTEKIQVVRQRWFKILQRLRPEGDNETLLGIESSQNIENRDWNLTRSKAKTLHSNIN